MNGRPAISLPRFDGPLDLLLELVRKNEVDIADIPIAEVTRQYLDYMHQAAQLDIDLGAEFTYIAATLIQLKSRSLLPTDPEIGVREPDLRRELIRDLLDHAQVQQAAEFLRRQLDVTGTTWSKSSTTESGELLSAADGPSADSGSMNLLELVRLAQKALDTARTHELLEFQKDEVSIEEMICWLRPRLTTLDRDHSLSFEPFFCAQPDRSRQISLFLALLELSKAGTVGLEQKGPFAPIHLTAPASNGTTVP